MIKINLRDKNRIITLEAIGKPPIRGRTSSSLYFHSPLELLLASLGLCIGGNIIDYCRLYDINTKVFEEVIISYDTSTFVLKIKKPKDFQEEHIKRLESTLTACLISRELVKPIRVEWEDNTIDTTELVKELPKGCCGG